MSTDHKIIVPGVCEDCGCTNEQSCQGGCVWVDDAMTLCSQCAHRREIAFLDDPLSELEQQLVVVGTQELERLPPLSVNIQPAIAQAICGGLQLAMRHPQMEARDKRLLLEFIGTYRGWLESHDCPHLIEMIRIGWIGTGCTEEGQLIEDPNEPTP